MRLLWISGLPGLGGGERATLALARLLGRRGHASAALCCRGSRLGAAFAEAGVPVTTGPLGRSADVRALGAVRRTLASVAPDVAVATTADEWVWACLARGRAPRPRLVLVRHMALPLRAPVRWLARRRADAVVAVSEASRRSLAGFDAERVSVIPPPLRFAPRATVPGPDERARARVGLGLPAEGRWLAFFGGTGEVKGVRDVLHAARRAGAGVLLCGPDGRARTDLVGEGALVHHLGETERVGEVMTAADVVVMATQRRLPEAFGLVLAEAMALGTPVAAYATGGMAEVVGDAGRLARPDDADDLAAAVAELLVDPAAACALAARALERARECFDPERVADRWEALLASVGARS